MKQENIHNIRQTWIPFIGVIQRLGWYMGFSKKEYWSGLPFPSPGDLSTPEIEPTSLASPALAGGFLTTSATWEPLA